MVQFSTIFVIWGAMTTMASPGVYFSTSKLRLTLPISQESYIILRNEPIVNLRLLSTNGFDSYSFRYNIESPHGGGDYLKVDDRTGNLWITSKILSLANVTEFIIVAMNATNAAARLSLTIDPQLMEENSLDRFCEHHLDRACFWDAVQYRVAENGPRNWTIGTLGPTFYRRLCPQHRLTYDLLLEEDGVHEGNAKNVTRSSDYLLVNASDGTLRTRVPYDLDSHAPGPALLAGVRCTVWQLGDPSGSSVQSINRTVTVTVNVNVVDCNDNRTAAAPASKQPRKKRDETSPATVSYPKEAVVYTSSRKFARIAEPVNFIDLSVRKGSDGAFFWLIDNPMKAFEITRIGGIIYLKNETAFTNQRLESRHEITVAWQNYSATIVLRLLKNPNARHCGMPVTGDDFCAVHANQSSCVGSCGVGSLLGPCEYRVSEGLHGLSGYVKDFPTCSSGLPHCPDLFCDPLEQMGHREKIQLCPQDCVFREDIYGDEYIMKTNRGILFSKGPCICDSSGQCCCAKSEILLQTLCDEMKTTSSTTTITTATPPVTEQRTWSWEYVAIVFIPMVFAGLIVLYYYFCRKNRMLADNAILQEGSNVTMYTARPEYTVNACLPTCDDHSTSLPSQLNYFRAVDVDGTISTANSVSTATTTL